MNPISVVYACACGTFCPCDASCFFGAWFSFCDVFHLEIFPEVVQKPLDLYLRHHQSVENQEEWENQGVKNQSVENQEEWENQGVKNQSVENQEEWENQRVENQGQEEPQRQMQQQHQQQHQQGVEHVHHLAIANLQKIVLFAIKHSQ